MAQVGDTSSFSHDWRAHVLAGSPMIAPARQYTYPVRVAGEDEAMARGALLVEVHPASGGTFLATCALGFSDPGMPTGVFACPNAREMCAVAGGYVYIIDTTAPERAVQIELRPVAEVVVLVEQGVLVFVGFHAMVAWGEGGLAWETGRLSWEGIRVVGVRDGLLHGFGWNLATDKEVEFSVDPGTGVHTGGGF